MSAQGWVACSNCDGRVCMACVLRHMHDDCRDHNCPDCADGLVPSEAVVEAAASPICDSEDHYDPSVVRPCSDHLEIARAALVAARRYEEGK